jgi:hypothetical protein
VDKSNFLEVYTKAHTLALTPENIKAVFCKTGVVLFNPSIITSDMMAPSLESSSKGSLPIPMSSPVHAVSDLIMKETGLDEHQSGPEELYVAFTTGSVGHGCG